MKVGEKLLLYTDQIATYDDAKSRCESYNSTLVEFRNEREFNEVDTLCAQEKCLT